MIELKNIFKKYGNNVIFENLNFTVDSGEIVGFIGPNGSGKTTTINMITGITKIDSGNILVNGKDILKNEIEVKKNIGLVPDEPNLFQRFKVKELFKFIAEMYEVEQTEYEKKVSELTKEFDIVQYLDTEISELSHGTRQKVNIISVLLHNPDIWILDEPLTGLDPQSAFKLKKIMKEHAKNNKTVFFSTHVLEVAEKLCTKIIIINKGKKIYEGTLETLKSKYPDYTSLEELFLHLINDGEKK
ncbi:MAG: ABC transporter ATP-binding protein [Clostridium sp.]